MTPDLYDGVDQELEHWSDVAQDPETLRRAIEGDPPDGTIQQILSEVLPPEVGYRIQAVWDRRQEVDLVDLGCGVGRLAEAVLFHLASYEVSPSIRAVDISEAVLARAPRNDQITYLCGDGRTIPCPAVSCDVVWSFLLFQHLPPPAVWCYIIEAARVLRPGGFLRAQFVEGRDDHFLSHGYGREQIETWASNAGFVLVQTAPSRIHPSWLWLTARMPGL